MSAAVLELLELHQSNGRLLKWVGHVGVSGHRPKHSRAPAAAEARRIT